MAHRFLPPDQDNFRPAIDQLADEARSIAERIAGRQAAGSRELREIWSRRQRPFWRLHPLLYRALARRFLDLGENFLAAEVADEGFSFFGDDVPLILTRALATARGGAPQAARALLDSKKAVLEGAPEAKSLLARTSKDLWKSSGDTAYLEQAFELYHADFLTSTTDRAFPGVNAASMALFLGRIDDAHRIAGEVVDILSKSSNPPNYWDDATLAECLLVAGRVEESRAAYTRATSAGGIPAAHLSTTRAQTRLLLKTIGQDAHSFDDCFPLPDVIVFSGHRIDGPDRPRPRPRFPAEREDPVKSDIRDVIREMGGCIGFAAAANGGDILFLECLQEAGDESFVQLPLPEAEFLQASVGGEAGSGWMDRYRQVTSAATEFTFSPELPLSPQTFDYGNRLLLGSALLRARQLGSKLHFLTVWNGEPGEPGGTGSFLQLARSVGCSIHVIDPLHGRTQAVPEIDAPPDSPRGLSTILAVRTESLDQEEKVAALIASHQLVHRQFRDGLIELVYEDLRVAVQAAGQIRGGLGPTINLGLHIAPLKMRPHPVTGLPVLEGFHGTCASQLAGLLTPGITYASSAIAAMLALETVPMPAVEFLGYRSFPGLAHREPVFRLLV